MRRLQDDRQMRAAATALSNLECRPGGKENWGGCQRHAEPVPGNWDRDGLRALRICQSRHTRRNRDPRPAFAGGGRDQTDLQESRLTTLFEAIKQNAL